MLRESQLEDCFNKKSFNQGDAILILLSVNSRSPKPVNEIQRLGKNAGIPEIIRWNMSAILNREREYAIQLPEGWLLTSKGVSHVKTLGILQQKDRHVVNEARNLRDMLSKITDKPTVEFLSEALTCFENGLYRAAVVLSWVGAISLLQNDIFVNHLSSFNIEAQRRNPKWKSAVTRDDLNRMQESDFLDLIGSPPLSVIGKNVKEELKNNCLQLRNSCGHPSSLVISESRVAAHLEILLLNVFSKFV